MAADNNDMMIWEREVFCGLRRGVSKVMADLEALARLNWRQVMIYFNRLKLFYKKIRLQYN